MTQVKIKNSLGKKIGLVFLIIVFLFLLASAFSIFSITRSGQRNHEISEEILPHTMRFLALEKHIIQIQQWLTDISATRAAEKYDDGFSKASTHFTKAEEIITQLIQAHQEAGETATVEQLSGMKQNLTNYYDMGKTMARAYIKGGPKAGNPIREQFDPLAVKLTKEVNALIKEHRKELQTVQDEIIQLDLISRVVIISATLAATLISIIAVMILISQIKKNAALIIGAMETASQGDLRHTAQLNTGDEFGLIADYLKRTLQNTSALIAKIKQGGDTLTQQVSQLNENSAVLSKAADQMTNKSTSVASATEEMNSTMGSVSSFSEETATNINSVATATEEMTSTIGEISSNTERARSIVSTTADKVGSAADSIKVLEKNAAEIDDIVEMVTEIAEQTNLLALNATIESARAGEAGQGFAVVASEVKALAKQTTEAIGGIRTQITSMNDSTTTAVKDVVSIKQEIDNVNNIVSSIATSIEEQSITTKEIAGNISEAVNGAKDVTRQISESAGVSGGISEDMSSLNRSSTESRHAVESMNGSVEKLNTVAEELKQLLAQFTIK